MIHTTLDFETDRFAPGNMAPFPVCLAIADELVAPEVLDVRQAEAALSDRLKSGHVLIGANTAYDMAVGCAAFPHLIPAVFDAYEGNLVRDILIRQKLIDIAARGRRGSYSLAEVALRLHNTKMDKGADTWRLRYSELRHVPIAQWPKEAIEYPKMDVDETRRCYWTQQTKLEGLSRQDILRDESAQCRADFALQLVSVWGICADAIGVAALRAQCEQRLSELTESLLEAGLLARKKDGTLQRKKAPTQERMYSAGGTKLTKSGQKLKDAGDPAWTKIKYLSTDEEACRDSGDPILESYAEYTATQSLLTGHVKAMEQGVDVPIHTRFDALMNTGRVSSSKPNIQNIRRAKGARECFVPRPGYCFVACDFDKAELHTLAQVCLWTVGWSNLADALNKGYDPHTGLGAQLAGVKYETARVLVDQGDAEMVEWRRRAKPANFGFPGGLGAPGMVRYAKGNYGVNMTETEARALQDGWRKHWPCIQQYLKWIRSMVEAGGGVTSIRHFVSERWRGHIPYTVAANSFFQGLCADAVKRALFEVVKQCYIDMHTPLYGCRVVNVIHDELLIEVPLDGRLTDAARQLRVTMVDKFNECVPDVPVSATPAAMDRWSKAAQAVYDEDGNMQIWTAPTEQTN